MGKSTGLLLTQRQLEVLRLRRQGLTQEEVARKLGISRENVSIHEKRAYRNIRKARTTLDALEKFEIAAKVTLRPKTHILEIPRRILEAADKEGIRMRTDCVEILEVIKSSRRSKIRGKRIVRPLTMRILPDGTYSVE